MGWVSDFLGAFPTVGALSQRNIILEAEIAKLRSELEELKTLNRNLLACVADGSEELRTLQRKHDKLKSQAKPDQRIAPYCSVIRHQSPSGAW